jgi:hypothetical protein
MPTTDETGMAVRSPGKFAERSPDLSGGQGRLTLAVSLPADLLGRCKGAAAEDGLTLAAWVRRVVSGAVAEKNLGKGKDSA